MGDYDLVSGKEHLLKKGFEWVLKMYLPRYCMYQYSQFSTNVLQNRHENSVG